MFHFFNGFLEGVSLERLLFFPPVFFCCDSVRGSDVICGGLAWPMSEKTQFTTCESETYEEIATPKKHKVMINLRDPKLSWESDQELSFQEAWLDSGLPFSRRGLQLWLKGIESRWKRGVSVALKSLSNHACSTRTCYSWYIINVFHYSIYYY